MILGSRGCDHHFPATDEEAKVQRGEATARPRSASWEVTEAGLAHWGSGSEAWTWALVSPRTPGRSLCWLLRTAVTRYHNRADLGQQKLSASVLGAGSVLLPLQAAGNNPSVAPLASGGCLARL